MGRFCKGRNLFSSTGTCTWCRSAYGGDLTSCVDWLKRSNFDVFFPVLLKMILLPITFQEIATSHSLPFIFPKQELYLLLK